MSRVYIAFSIVFSCLNAFSQFTKTISQDKLKQEIRDQVWSDTSFNQPYSVPEKWNNESAVILNKKHLFDYKRMNSLGIATGNGNFLCTEELIRSRVLINDKEALEKFSEFYYYDIKIVTNQIFSNGSFYPASVAGFKIIKKNGEEKNIDLEELSIDYGENSNPSRLYSSITLLPKKVAIPNLEVGDVVDYFYFLRSFYVIDIANKTRVRDAFDTEIIPFNNNYPTCNQTIEVTFGTANNRYYLNAIPLNSNKNFVVKRDKKADHYIIINKNLEAANKTQFSGIEPVPAIKFKAFIMTSTSKDYFGQKQILNTKPPMPIDIYRASLPFSSVYPQQYAKMINKLIKENYRSGTESQKLYAAYYIFKYVYFYHSQKLRDKMTRFRYYYMKTEEDRVIPEFFVRTMQMVLKKMKIKSFPAVTINKKNGTIDELVTADENFYLLAYYDQNGKINYLFPFTRYSDFGDVPVEFSNQKAILLKSLKDLRSVTLPKTSFEKNYKITSIKTDISNLEPTSTIEKTVENFGGFKETASDYYLTPDDFKLLQLKKYYSKEYEKLDDKESFILKQKEANESRKKEIEESLANNGIDLSRYISFDIIDYGFDDPKKSFIYKEEFEVKDFLTKAGKNYFLQPGKLFQKIKKIDDSFFDKRQQSIYLNYPKSYQYSITITLPENYNVQNIDEFNFDLNNAVGSFSCSSVQTGKQLTITYTKTYKKDIIQKEEFEDLKTILNTSYNFSQQKILIRKG